MFLQLQSKFEIVSKLKISRYLPVAAFLSTMHFAEMSGPLSSLYSPSLPWLLVFSSLFQGRASPLLPWASSCSQKHPIFPLPVITVFASPSLRSSSFFLFRKTSCQSRLLHFSFSDQMNYQLLALNLAFSCTEMSIACQPKCIHLESSSPFRYFHE